MGQHLYYNKTADKQNNENNTQDIEIFINKISDTGSEFIYQSSDEKKPGSSAEHRGEYKNRKINFKNAG